jgi:hypothetical protein
LAQRKKVVYTNVVNLKIELKLNLEWLLVFIKSFKH